MVLKVFVQVTTGEGRCPGTSRRRRTTSCRWAPTSSCRRSPAPAPDRPPTSSGNNGAVTAALMAEATALGRGNVRMSA